MGALSGIKVIELAGIGPAPFCCMLLADMGADVIRIDRFEPQKGEADDPRLALLNRNKRSVAIDLKTPDGANAAKRMITDADVLVEGFRPGAAERLGLGPDELCRLNPGLIYGRMTGWGQDGPLAPSAGHDINFISLVGILNAIGPRDGAPVPPLNLIGDFGGGGIYLAFGIVCALLERQVSGVGQIVDAAMIDGSASLMTSLFSAIARGQWRNTRADNILDGGAPWYSTYITKDDKYISIGSIEPQFFRELIARSGLDIGLVPDRFDRENWPRLRELFQQLFRNRTRDEWAALLEGTDACFSPVLDPWEATQHPHLKARGVFVEHEGVVQPAPAPRLSRTPGKLGLPPPRPGEHTSETLLACGFTRDEVDALSAMNIIRQH